MQGPQLEISLPQGWGVGELQALLAPVRDVEIKLVGEGTASISFRSEDSARAAACLMQLNQGALGHSTRCTPASPSVPGRSGVGTVATMLLVSHRHTWRLVEGVHASLLEMLKGGPVSKADTLLQRLQVASLMRQLEDQTSETLKYKQELDSRVGELSVASNKASVTSDIQEQLNEAALIIQSTQKQLQQARERARKSETTRDEALRKQTETSVELAEAAQKHVSELERLATEHATVLGDIDLSDAATRFQITEAESRAEVQGDTHHELHDITATCLREAMLLATSYRTALATEREAHTNSLGTIEENKLTIERNLSTHKEQAAHTDAQSAITQKIIDDLVAAKEAADDSLAARDERIFELGEALKESQHERGDLDAANVTLAEEVENLTKAFEKHSGELEAVLAESSEKDAAVQQLQGELSDLSHQNGVLLEDTGKYQSQVAHLQRLHEEQQNASNHLTIELEELRANTQPPETADGCCNTSGDLADTEELEALRQDVNARTAEMAMWKKEAELRCNESADLAKLEQKVKIYFERETQLKNALRKSGLELDRLSGACHSAQAALQSKQQVSDSLEAQVKELMFELTSVSKKSEEDSWVKERHDTISLELQTAKQETLQSANEARQYQDECQRLRAQLEESEKVQDIEREKHRSIISDHKARIERLTDEASKSRTRMQQAAASLEQAVSVQSEEATRRHEAEKQHTKELQKLRESLTSRESCMLQMKAEVEKARRELKQERARREDLEQYMLASKEASLISKQEMDAMSEAKRTLAHEVAELKKERSSDAGHTTLLHKKLMNERDDLSHQLSSLQARFAVFEETARNAEEREAALQSDVEDLMSAAGQGKERYIRAESELEESVAKNIETMKLFGQYKSKCEALEEELKYKVEPVPEKECQQCEVYQAARRLQQEVLSGMQLDVTDANAEAEASRLKLEDTLAANQRLEMEAASLRAMLAEANAHTKTLEHRPSGHEHARLLERLASAEGAAATLEKRTTEALRDARDSAEKACESDAEVSRLQTYVLELEQKLQQTTASYQSRIDNQDQLIKSAQEAVFKAEHDDWGPGSLTLHVDGRFAVEEKGGHWSLDIEQEVKDDRAQGLELRLRWTDGGEEVLVSDNRGELWLGAKGARLEIVGRTPDWFSSRVFKKGFEEAEARATAAQWRAASCSPRGALLPVHASPTRTTVQPLPPSSPSVKSIITTFQALYPNVDPASLSGVAANVADGIMDEAQARQMLSEMSEGDAFEDM